MEDDRIRPRNEFEPDTYIEDYDLAWTEGQVWQHERAYEPLIEAAEEASLEGAVKALKRVLERDINSIWVRFEFEPMAAEIDWENAPMYSRALCQQLWHGNGIGEIWGSLKARIREHPEIGLRILPAETRDEEILAGDVSLAIDWHKRFSIGTARGTSVRFLERIRQHEIDDRRSLANDPWK